MKALRVKQYGYMVCTAVLFVVTIFAIFTGIRTASAEQSIVTITSPKPDQKLAQKAQTITGRAPALKRVRVFDGTKLIGDATADVQGNWNLAWKAVLPGQHQLNAYLVDGTLYKTAPLSDQSLTGVSLNNGQPITNYTTGLSNPDSLVYDQSNQYTYALNRNNHTVSVVNTNTKAYVSTISYATADALAPNSYDTSPCHCKNYAYAYDANSRQLFIFDLERIYIISTQTNQVARTITLDMPVQDGEASGTPEYRLYVDQQAQYVYFYVAAGTYNDQPIQRYNVGTGQKDQDFNIEGGRVVVAHNGDVYYINKNGSDATNAEGGRLYKYGGAKVDLSSVGCQTADDENLAASVTQNSIYVGCYDGPATSSPSKQIAINTENGALSDVSLANDASMKWLTQGNLVADRLALYSGSGNLTIKSLNTSNNQPLPDISYPSLGDSQPAQSLRSSFAVSTDGKYTFIASSGDGVLIFKTINSETASDIASYVYKYSWSTNNSEVTIGARQMNFFPSIDYLLQDFKKPVFVGDNIMYISLQPANALELLDTTSGDFQEISHGVAAPRKVYSSKQNNRLFTMADSTLRDNDTLVPFLSNQIKVSNLQTGAYEQTITLGVRDFAFAGYVSPDGNQLYIFSMDAADLFSGSNDAPITIYRFNTQTLTIDKTYQDIAHEDAGYEAQLLYGLTLNESNMGMSGDELIYGNLDTTKVYFLNVNSGELRTYTNTPDAPVTSNNALPFAGALAVDPTGKYVAVFHGVHFDDGLFGREVKVIKVSDLSVQSTDVSTRVGTALSFTESGELLVGSFSQSADASFTLLNPDDASIIKNKTSLISLGLKFSSGNVSLICWPTAAHPLKEGGEYVAFTLVCLNISSESYLFTTQQVLIDGRNFNYLNALETSNFSNISSDQVSVFAALNSMGAPLADTTVSLATQNVKVVADSISITQPAANKKIAAGERTITGTATPDQTLTIKIDGKSIGSVTADEYGLWSKKYRFEGTESKIKAEFVVPSRDKAFINTVDANMQDSTFRSRMATVSIDGGVEKIVELPDGLVAVSSIASQKAGKVYAIGFQPNSGGGRLLTFDAKTSALISNVSLDNDFLSALSSENGTSFNGVVSKDGTLLYILAGGNLLQVRTADGSLQRSYQLGQEFSDAAQDIPPFAGSIAISEKHKQAAIPYMNGKGTAFLDMNTGIVTHIAVPDGVTIIKALFDDTRDSIYVYTSYQEAQSISYTVSAFALSSMDMLW